jgi:hypothetical protein
MANPIDTLITSGYMTFGGDDQSGLLTAGYLRVGTDLTQVGSFSTKSLRTDGTAVEFYGTGNHGLSFQNPSASLSRLAGFSLLDGGTLQPTTSFTVTGTTTIDTSSTFDGQFLGSGTAEFFGKVKILDLAQVNASNLFNTMFFHDSLIVAPTGSYSGFNSIFQGTDGIPDASYVHMYLRQGVHLTLTHPLSMTGGLNIQNDNITGNPADTVTVRLNGHKITANGIGITGYGRFTMDSIADTLEVFQDVTFRGVDQDTSLTAGVIRIGRGFAQNGQFSPRSFAPAGTRTEFYGSLTHQASFTDPNISGGSYFAGLSVVDNGTLQPLTMFAVSGSTTVGSAAHFNGQLIPLGSVVDFFGPVTVQGGGDFLAPTSPAFFNFYGNSGLTVLPGAPTPYDVLNTGFVNNNAVPDLSYRNLFLDGTDSVRFNNVTATGNISVVGHTVIDNGFTLHAADSLIVDGASAVLENVNGFAVADEVFIAVNGGTYLSQSALAGATVKHVVWNGGNQTGLLTAGGMDVTGDFTQGGPDPESFVADSGFTTQFGGTGTHLVYFSTPSMTGGGGSHFGSLSFTTDAGVVLNVLSDIWAEGKLTTTSNSTPTLQNGTVPLRQLYAQDVDIQGIVFDHVQFHLAKTTGVAAGAGAMNNVTFQNFLASEDQFLVDLPGETTQYDWGGFNFTQLNPGDSGHYLVATDTDGGPTILDISLGTNNWGVTDPPFYVGLNGAVITPFAP